MIEQKQIKGMNNGVIPTSAIGSVTAANTLGNVQIVGRYAYCISNASALLTILDVSNPSAPIVLGSVGTATSPAKVVVRGRYAYVITNTSSTLGIFDISNPSAPVSVGSVAINSPTNGLYVAGRYAFILAGTSNTMQIIDLIDVTAPVIVSTTAIGTSARDMVVQGKFAYIINRTTPLIQVFDISNAAAPASVGSLTINANERGFFLQGRYAYITNDGATNNLQIVDISNPAAMTIVSTTSVAITVPSIYVQGKLAYISGTVPTSVLIYNISNPASPVLLGSFSIAAASTGLAISGRYCYITNGSTLQVFDLGGIYIQQLEVGGLEVGEVQTRGDVKIGNLLITKGGANIGGDMKVDGKFSSASLTADLALKEDVANKATDFSVVNNTKYPSVQAVKTYADGLVAGLLDDRGNWNASGNLFPSGTGSGTAGSVLKGDLWYISVAGVLGGVAVNIGDSVRALVDTPGQTAGNWDVLESNIGYVPENVANKATDFSVIDNTKYPTTQAVANLVGVSGITVQNVPADPATTTSSVGVMMGLAIAFTPARSGVICVWVCGDIDNNTVGDGAQIQVREGTGTAPVNGAALTGTAHGPVIKMLNPNEAGALDPATPGRYPFSLNCTFIGLVVGTTYWMDLSLARITGGTARIRDISIMMNER